MSSNIDFLFVQQISAIVNCEPVGPARKYRIGSSLGVEPRHPSRVQRGMCEHVFDNTTMHKIVAGNDQPQAPPRTRVWQQNYGQILVTEAQPAYAV